MHEKSTLNFYCLVPFVCDWTVTAIPSLCFCIVLCNEWKALLDYISLINIPQKSSDYLCPLNVPLEGRGEGRNMDGKQIPWETLESLMLLPVAPINISTSSLSCAFTHFLFSSLPACQTILHKVLHGLWLCFQPKATSSGIILTVLSNQLILISGFSSAVAIQFSPLLSMVWFSL